MAISAAEERPEVGTPPRGPEGLRSREWIAVLKRTTKEFMQDDCMGLAQQVAYSSLLAFFPAVIFLIGFLGLIHAFDDVQIFVGTVAPHGVISFIEEIQRDSAKSGVSATAFVIGFFGAVWAASGAMNSVIKAVNRAYDRTETRPFWRVRITSIVLVGLSGLTTAGVFLLIVVGGPLGEAIAKKARLGGAFDLFWTILRWPIAFVAVLIFFALVYYLGPNRSPRSWKWVTPGSVVGSIGWLVLSALFALYVHFAGSYSKTYGSLATGIILLLWLNYSAMALLFGAELNAETDRQAEIHAAGGPNAGLVKPAGRR
jgi:membrane protein